jgi:hypothetical protein
MRQPYRLLTLGLALCAVAALVGALILLNRSHTVDVDAQVGDWLLTVAAALVLTGALSMVVKQIDQRRSERQAWHDILNDLVAANQKLALARVRLKRIGPPGRTRSNLPRSWPRVSRCAASARSTS